MSAPRPQITTGSGQPSSADETLVGCLIRDLGGATFALTIMDRVTATMKKWSKNMWWNRSIDLVRGSTPIAILGYNSYASIKSYYERKSERYAFDRELKKIKELMKIQHPPDQFSLDLGREVLEWLLSNPPTEHFKVLGYYDQNFNQFQGIPTEGKCRVLLEYESGRSVFDITFTRFNNNLYPNNLIVWWDGLYTALVEFRKVIFKEFIGHFDTSKNVILYRDSGLSLRKRQPVPHKINQFDVHGLAQEIISAIQKRKKRAYALVGDPGNGKSLVFQALETILKDYPFLYAYPNLFRYEGQISEPFEFFKLISPCIVVFEDLDSYRLSKKGSPFFNDFLEGFDSTRNESNVIFLASLNYANLVHPTIINRRGRFDKVYYLSGPKGPIEIYDVLQCRHLKNTGKESFPLKMHEISTEFFKQCRGLSRADICEVIDNIELNNSSITPKHLETSLETVLDTQEALKKCQVDGVQVERETDMINQPHDTYFGDN